MENVKRLILMISTSVSLLALLVYTFFHTGATLARYVEPWFIGYIAAAGIETAVISMSIRIADLRRLKRDDRLMVGVLIAVLSVSTLANVYEGFHVQYGEALTLASLQRLDILQALIGLASTGLISLVVFAMSEVVSADVEGVVKEQEKERKTIERKLGKVPGRDAGITTETLARLSNTEEVDTAQHPALVQFDTSLDDSTVQVTLRNGTVAATVDNAREAKATQEAAEQSQREVYILQLVKAGRGINWTQVAKEMGVSRATIYNDRARLVDRGSIAEVEGQWTSANGHLQLA